ncbi:hypothetical protein VAE142_330002 [Vibrio aestuarianus]|nr:hypothetical protein VAE142_330002 [Vibrio aestuarianus]
MGQLRSRLSQPSTSHGQKRVIDFTKLAIDGLGKVLQTTVSND